MPSAKNSGLDMTSKLFFLLNFFKTSLIFSAVLTGKVDFSITILLLFDLSAILLAHASTFERSAANPFPFPVLLVGYLLPQKSYVTPL